MAESRRDLEAWLRAQWAREGRSATGSLLAALSAGYRLGLRVRAAAYDARILTTVRLPGPVISIGNITLGGTGKTPLVELAVRELAALGTVPAVISRGYGRASRGVVVVSDGQTIRAGILESGDEPRLLAERLPGIPLVVGENRAEAGRVALRELGATVLVLDDGFQNRTVAKDLEVVVVSGRDPWGRGHVFPRGPLREPLAALARAQLVVITDPREDAPRQVAARLAAAGAARVPVVTATYEVTGARRAGESVSGPRPLAGRRVLGFAGLAAPAGFADTVRAAGAQLAELIPFPDHHWYGPRDLAALERRAHSIGAEALVTTEKDWVKLRELGEPPIPLWVLAAELRIDDNRRAWDAALRQAVEAASPRRDAPRAAP